MISYIQTSGATMRQEASIDSKVVSEALFGERVTVKQVKGEWLQIVTPDDYEGWLLAEKVTWRKAPYETALKVSRLRAHIYNRPDTEYGPFMTLPFEAPLKEVERVNARWIKVALPNDETAFIQTGDVLPIDSDLATLSLKFLDLPYTWGGRSSFGYDCSGFVQMLYRQKGITLKRDSKEQVLDDRFQGVSLEELKPGDLIFFGKEAREVRHVGLFLGDGKFIHATVGENKPWIRISSLTDFEWSGHPEACYPYRLGRSMKAAIS